MSCLAQRLRNRIRRVMFPLPEDHPADKPWHGFEPNWYIRLLRRVSAGLIAVLRLNRNQGSYLWIKTGVPMLAAPGLEETDSSCQHVGGPRA